MLLAINKHGDIPFPSKHPKNRHGNRANIQRPPIYIRAISAARRSRGPDWYLASSKVCASRGATMTRASQLNYRAGEKRAGRRKKKLLIHLSPRAPLWLN